MNTRRMGAVACSMRCRARVLLGLVLVAVPLVSACRHTTPQADSAPSELRAGIAPIYPPIAFKRDGRIEGVEADFARRLPTALGIPVTPVELQWDDLIPALTAGRIDMIMSGMSITPTRSRLVSFTDPYLQVGQMALIRKADYLRLRDPSAMDRAGTRVGFQTGTTGEAFARRALTLAGVQGFNTPEDGIVALRAGQIDFFIHDAPTIWRTTGGLDRKDPDLTGLYRPLTQEYLAWAVRKNDQALRERLNAALQQWKSDGGLDAVLDRWITVRKVTLEGKPLQ